MKNLFALLLLSVFFTSCKTEPDTKELFTVEVKKVYAPESYDKILAYQDGYFAFGESSSRLYFLNNSFEIDSLTSQKLTFFEEGFGDIVQKESTVPYIDDLRVVGKSVYGLVSQENQLIYKYYLDKSGFHWRLLETPLVFEEESSSTSRRFLNTDQYLLGSCCYNEQYGSVMFGLTNTNYTYSYPSVCLDGVLPIQGEYLAWSHPFTGKSKYIDPPESKKDKVVILNNLYKKELHTKMYKLPKVNQMKGFAVLHDELPCNWWEGRTVYDFYSEVLVDTLDLATFMLFDYQDTLYTVGYDYEKSFIGKVNNKRIEYVQDFKLYSNDVSSTPIVYSDRNKAFHSSNYNSVLEVRNDTITRYVFARQIR